MVLVLLRADWRIIEWIAVRADMRSSPIVERIIESRYHSKCPDCGQPIVPGTEVRYLPKDERVARLKARVRHAEGQCPAVMAYTVQLMYQCTSKTMKTIALSANEAIAKVTPKGTTNRPCEYVVRQGNVVVLRRVA